MSAAQIASDRRAARPRLRPDLRVSLDSGGAFLVEDPLRGQFHRVGSAEFAVLSRLDGSATLAEAAADAARQAAPPIALARLETLAQWLSATGLLANGSAAAPHKPAALANPTYIKIPLPLGDRFLARANTALGWLFSGPALAIVALLTLVAACQIIVNWSAFTASAHRILCPDQHLLLAACWLFLKLFHELGHGIASRRYGGDVREFGIAIIFFVPVPYTDVTSSWRCPRRERMLIAAAGMYFEWLIALLAVALWSATSSAPVQQACVYTVGLATFTTIVFNANPLCRMDGYYILSDALGLQNLAAHGQRISRAWLTWLLLGQAAPDPTGTKHRFAIGCYGLLARLWRTLSLVTMAALALMIYEGLGLLMLGSILLAWRLQARATQSAQPATSTAKPRLSLAGGLRMVLVAAAFGLALWLTPWPGGITAPGSVENVERHVIRAPCPAQLTEILIATGDPVVAGQAVALLKSDKLELELAELESAFAQGEVKQRSQRTKKQLVDLQVETHRQQSLAERIAQCREKLDSLTLRAPIAGRAISRRIADLKGSYLAEGAEICTVVSDHKEFRLLIAEPDLAAFAGCVGKDIQVSLAGHSRTGILDRLDPAATTSAEGTNLVASAGGPLPVVPEPNAAWRLQEPRVVGHVRLAANESAVLLAGQRGFATIKPRDYSVGQRMAAALRAWLEKLSQQAHERTAHEQPAQSS